MVTLHTVVSDVRRRFFELKFHECVKYNVTGVASSHKHQLSNDTNESGEQMGVEFKKYSQGENITFVTEVKSKL